RRGVWTGSSMREAVMPVDGLGGRRARDAGRDSPEGPVLPTSVVEGQRVSPSSAGGNALTTGAPAVSEGGGDAEPTRRTAAMKPVLLARGREGASWRAGCRGTGGHEGHPQARGTTACTGEHGRHEVWSAGRCMDRGLRRRRGHGSRDGME